MWNPLYNSITAQSESGNRDYDKFGRPIRSPAGAMYAMQTMPGTARDPGFGVRPAQNNSPDEFNRVGRDYRDAMFKRYGNDPAKGWGAYNWGPGNMDKALKQFGDDWLSHAPAETQSYVNKNMKALGGNVKPTTLADLINVPEEAPFSGASLMGDPIGNQAATLGDLVQNTGLPAPKQKFFGKGGPGTYLLGGLADGLTMWASGGQQRGQSIPNMMQMAQNEEERTYDLARRREELDAAKEAAQAAAAKPYRFQNNNGDVVEVNPMTGATSVLYADPSPKPNWMRVENSDGSINMVPGAGGVRPSQAHIDALQSNPNMAADFDAKFGRGMAQYYLGGR